MSWRAALLACWGCWSVDALADTKIEVCFNYGCEATAQVLFSETDLAPVAQLFEAAPDAEVEREAISQALGLLYRVAGLQTPVVADRGGNLRDEGVHGRMDCIDHSTSTTRLLSMLEGRGLMRHHRVVEPVRRGFVLSTHFSAAIEVLPSVRRDAGDGNDHVGYLLALCDCPDVLQDLVDSDVQLEMPMPQFVVDTWFLDHAEPAVVLPLADWLRGGGPDVQ